MRISPKFYSVNLIYKARRQKTDQTNERLEHSEDFLIENKTHRSGVLCIFIAKNMLSLWPLWPNTEMWSSSETDRVVSFSQIELICQNQMIVYFVIKMYWWFFIKPHLVIFSASVFSCWLVLPRGEVNNWLMFPRYHHTPSYPPPCLLLQIWW